MHTIGTTIISCYCLFMVLGQNHDLHKYFRQNQIIIENQNVNLRKTNEELDRFVYSASHDLRAPLSSIKGLVTLMDLDKQTPPREYLSKIVKSISVMESFINDIVDYSRNARTEVKREPIPLHVMVGDIQKSLGYFDNAPRISIENRVDLEEIIFSDPHRLRVILTNLVSNSIKYADLRKENPHVRISSARQNGQQEIRIEDNGIGIAPDHLPKIFNMFYRASAVSKGSGLGLYIVKESAEKMKYKIDVQSEVGKGSVFSIRVTT